MRDLFVGQRKLGSTPYDWTDMSVKNPYDSDWKQRVRSRIRRSDGVIALISSSTPKATGQLWEIECAREEGKLHVLLGEADPSSVGRRGRC